MARFVLAGLVALGLPVLGTTLQQLTLTEISQQATSIVRGRLQPSYTAFRGSVIYTHYQIQVTDQWKGTPASQIDIAVPGGAVQGVRQTYSGSPTLATGQDYVLFLWTSRSGLTQIMGLSQGLFSILSNPAGTLTVMRAASSENMLNASGHAINDSNFSMPLSAFKASVINALAGKGGSK